MNKEEIDELRKFTFFPDAPTERQYRAYDPSNPRPKRVSNPWKAPEHVKMSAGMQRNKDPKKGPVGHLVVDRRPEIMVPKRKPIILDFGNLQSEDSK